MPPKSDLTSAYRRVRLATSVALAVVVATLVVLPVVRAVDARATAAHGASAAAIPSNALDPVAPGDPGAFTPVSSPADVADAFDEIPPAALDAEALGPLSAVCADGQSPGDHLGEVAGRTYRIHIPASSRGTGAPLVVNFHGSSRTAADQEDYSGLLPLADREGFAVVSPEGSGSPSGWDIPGVYHDIGVDDVAFVQDLVAQITSTTCIDLNRIYATGFSNGAQMAAQVACFLPDIFAAVAPVSGLQYQGCDGEPVPLIAFHGTADQNIPYDWPADAATPWALHDGCAGGTDELISEHVTARVFSECAAGVVFYTIEGGGHTWPGAEDDTGGVGFTTHEISASEIIWQFFAAHPKV